METQKLRLSAVVVPDGKKGFSGFFKEFPQALSYGKTMDELYSNLFNALEVLRKMNKENEAAKNHTHVANVEEYELEMLLAS